MISTSFTYIPVDKKQMFYDFLKQESKNASKEDKHFLSEARISHFYGCEVLCLYSSDRLDITSFISYKITRDGYMNIYFIYTTPEERGKGYQKQILDYAFKIENPTRIYSLASTIHSVVFYHKRGYKFYGYNDRKELVMDTPLITSIKTLPTKAIKTLKKNKVSPIPAEFSEWSEDQVIDFISENYPEFNL